MPLEREIKLRFDSAEEARAKILALGAAPLLGRRLQEDCLFDTEDERLRWQRSMPAFVVKGQSLLTLKGPAIPGLIKIREERDCGRRRQLQTILEEPVSTCGSATKSTARNSPTTMS